MTAPALRRAAMLVMVVGLAGCGFDSADTPPAMAPSAGDTAALPSYDYLPKLRLDVSDIIIDDTWTPRAASGEHVEEIASPRPVEALSRMVHDRLVAGGGTGAANVVVEDASLVRVPGQLIGSFSVQVILPVGAAVATISGTRLLSADLSLQATASLLVQDLMTKMNVELEYQVRHGLAEHMVGDTTPTQGAVRTQDLPPVPRP